MLGIEYPLFQGHGLIATGRLAKAALVGGLGIIGSGTADAAWVEQETAAARSITDRPFELTWFGFTPHRGSRRPGFMENIP